MEIAAKHMIDKRRTEVDRYTQELKVKREEVARLSISLEHSIMSLSYWQGVYAEEAQAIIKGLAHTVETLTKQEG